MDFRELRGHAHRFINEDMLCVRAPQPSSLNEPCAKEVL